MYDMQPPQPVQMPVREEKKRMSVPQIMLIVLALAFVIWYLVTSLAPETAPYAQITAGVIGARYTGDCLIVRDETPFDEEGVSNVEYLAEEGTYVSIGTLQDFRDQIKDYQVKLLKAEINTDSSMEKLESDVMNRAREVRELIGGARGNMNNQEAMLAEAINARQNRLREKYSEDQRMTRLYDDEQGQLQKISSWTQKKTAPKEGLVSFYSDGYEYDLTIDNYDKYTPSQVRAMINGQKPPSANMGSKGKAVIYRLVRDGHWIVLMLIKDSNWNPVEGAVYELKLENFKDTMVQARVISFTRTGGELEVRLDVQSNVQPVLYIRTCSGVLGDNVTSLTVPTKAIYTQDNMPGVVVIDGEYPFFIPVNIVDERDGMVYISPIQQGTLYEGQTVKLF